MPTHITITAHFDNVNDAADFMSRGGHPSVSEDRSAAQEAAKPTTRVKKADTLTPTGTALPPTLAPITTAAPEPVAPPASTATPPAAQDANVALVMPTAQPTPQPAAPKEPNKPVQAVANVAKTPVPLHPATIEGIRAALKDVFNGRGATAATAILQKFGAVSVSTVAKEKYADFVKECAAS